MVDIYVTKTWDDIEYAALFEPVLQAVITMYRRGDITKEQALITACLALVEIKHKQYADLLDAISRQLSRHV